MDDENGDNSSNNYTLEDYDEISQDRRIELIDGKIYEMEEPSFVHQLILTKLLEMFDSCMMQDHEACAVLTAPVEVQLDQNDRTMLQPDLVIVCDRSRIMNRGLFGTPDLVVEILSEDTAKKDMYVKLDKYVRAGVREYWLVDPDKKQVLVYDFEDDSEAPFMSAYTFDEAIPVWIFEGQCRINFQEINEAISLL